MTLPMIDVRLPASMWLAEASTGPLYTEEARRCREILDNSDSTPRERDDADTRLCQLDHDQEYLADGYYEALRHAAMSAGRAMGWQPDTVEMPHHAPPVAHTPGRVLAEYAKAIVTVEYERGWKVYIDGALWFEM